MKAMSKSDLKDLVVQLSNKYKKYCEIAKAVSEQTGLTIYYRTISQIIKEQG